MKKWKIGVLFFFGLLGVLFVVGRITGAIQYYKTPTISGEPGLKTNQHFLSSKLVKPKRFDLVCYEIKGENGIETRVHRLCGMAADVVEMRNGVLYINRQNADTGLALAHNYLMAAHEVSLLDKFMDVNSAGVIYMSSDSVSLFLPDKTVTEKNIPCHLFIDNAINEEIKKQYNMDWNADHFGPVTVPAGQFFFVGDNRHNSLDSRYVGTLPVESIIGTVVWK